MTHPLMKRVMTIQFLLSAIFVFAGWFWSFIALHGIAQPLIIHFTKTSGITQIGGRGDLLGIAILGIIMIGVNARIAYGMLNREAFWAFAVSSATLFFSLLIFIGFAAIINVN